MSKGTVERWQPRIAERMEMFEVYEANGNLLLVTSGGDLPPLEPGDRIYRRVWSTGNAPILYNEARETP